MIRFLFVIMSFRFFPINVQNSFLDGVAVVILGFCSFVNFILFTQFVKSSSPPLSTSPAPSTFP